MATRYAAILFDFDYTLADSSRGIIACFEHAFNALGLPCPSHDAIRATIGLSLPLALEQLAGPQPEDAQEIFLKRFQERADSIMADLTILYEGVPATIRGLERRGYPMGIVSNKYRYRIEAVLNREGLSRFDVIVGDEDVERLKPWPDGLLKAMGSLGMSPANVLYVGDSVADAEAAERAGVPFVAVLSGVTPAAALVDRSVAVLGGVPDLPRWLGEDVGANRRARLTG